MKATELDNLFDDGELDVLHHFDLSKAKRATEVPHLNKLREQESGVVRMVSGQPSELNERKYHE
ncbi:MAG: hypothetical protein EOM59_12835 [Clostridia bacterium]|nr:hypothetical protein [Clostridia bacterium]